MIKPQIYDTAQIIHLGIFFESRATLTHQSIELKLTNTLAETPGCGGKGGVP
jgi:hypothetical protein